MKKIISSLILVGAFTSMTLAQRIPSSAEKRIELVTKVMATELQLNEVAYVKLKTLNRERILKADEVAAMYVNNPAITEAKLNAIETNFDKQLAALLNPVQLAAYKNYQQAPDVKLTALKMDKPESKKVPVKSTLGKNQPKR